ncbi:hypothetical protein ACGLD6_002496 [Escherichia coli]
MYKDRKDFRKNFIARDLLPVIARAIENSRYSHCEDMTKAWEEADVLEELYDELAAELGYKYQYMIGLRRLYETMGGVLGADRNSFGAQSQQMDRLAELLGELVELDRQRHQ